MAEGTHHVAELPETTTLGLEADESAGGQDMSSVAPWLPAWLPHRSWWECASCPTRALPAP